MQTQRKRIRGSNRGGDWVRGTPDTLRGEPSRVNPNPYDVEGSIQLGELRMFHQKVRLRCSISQGDLGGKKPSGSSFQVWGG